MKKLFTLLYLLPTFLLAQKKYTLSDTNVRIDSTTGGMIYTEVVPVEGATADQLYSRAKSFLLKAFTNESAVTQLDDKANSVVGGRGKFAYSLNMGQMLLTGSTQMYYEMAVEIRVKDGRYKYELSNIEVINQGYRVKVDDQLRKNPKLAQKLATKEMSEKEYDKYMGEKNPINNVVRQLKAAMNNPKDKNDF